jgi:TolA-binding protein
VHVTEGALVLNTRGRHATEVVAGAARIAVADAQVRVKVRGGKLIQVQVFAGAAELTAAGRTRIIATGEIWRAPPEPGPAGKPAGLTAAPARARAPAALEPPRTPPPAVRAFQIGWQALRDGRYPDAILAFDRATDAAVVEDARYWAAVAAARAGHQADAQARLRAFLQGFPSSPHAAQARAALRP